MIFAEGIDLSMAAGGDFLGPAKGFMLVLAWILILVIFGGGAFFIYWYVKSFDISVTIHDLVQGGYIRKSGRAKVKEIDGSRRFLVRGFKESLDPPPPSIIFRDGRNKKCVDLIMANKALDYLDVRRFHFLSPESVLTGDVAGGVTPSVTAIPAHRAFWASVRTREKAITYRNKQPLLMQLLPYMGPIITMVIVGVLAVILFNKFEEVSAGISSASNYCSTLLSKFGSAQPVT